MQIFLFFTPKTLNITTIVNYCIECNYIILHKYISIVQSDFTKCIETTHIMK